MSSNGSCQGQQPHALLFPYPVQGHINPMMRLAKLLLDEGFFITFVNTDFNHERMFKKKGSSQKQQALHLHPNLRFEHLPDGLPPGHMRANQKSGILEFTAAILALPGPFGKLVRRIVDSSASGPPLTCIVADAFCSWMQDVADKFRIPRVSLWTTPAHANLAYTFQHTLESHGLIPVTDKKRLAEEVRCIEGIAPMKLEDYISFFLINTTTDFIYQWHLRFCMRRPDEALWNLGNNFEAFESGAVNSFKKEVPNFLPIGPLLPAEVLCGSASPDAASAGVISLWPEDTTCKEWLSQHGEASVVYISFGSIANMSEEELAEFIAGLEESGAPFIWAVRPDQGGAALAQLRDRVEAEAAGDGTPSRRALIVSWVPQISVLLHPSVGLFLSHCGWNSILESLTAGVPILAKAGGFAEQRMNAHYVEEVWKIGTRLPAGASASVVKSRICGLLGDSPKAAEARERVEEVRRLALAAVSPNGGSSYSNWRRFVEDMQSRAAASC